MSEITVVIADDNPVVRSGLVSVLEATGEIRVVGEAGNGGEAVELVQRHKPDLVLLDVRMPRVDGIAAVQRIGRTSRVLMLTYTDDPDAIRAAIRHGASGYLLYGSFSSEELVEAIFSSVREQHNPLSPAAVNVLMSTVREPSAPEGASREARARFGLSPREAEVMDLISQGKANREIAAELFLTEKTVKNHVNRVFAKLGVENRAAAIAHWLGTIVRDR
ncbi:response regulator [Spirillospora sp. NPDC127200]